MDKPNFSRDLTSSASELQQLQQGARPSSAKGTPEKGVSPNKFSFTNFFSPISGRSRTPSISSESPSVIKWSSRVSSFVGSLFEKKDSCSSFDNLTIGSSDFGETVVHSSPETVRVVISTPMSFGTSSSSFNNSSSQEATLPQQGFFQAGDRDRETFVAHLMKKLQEAKTSENPDQQTKKDINRISYFLNGKKVQDINAVKSFLGEAAEAVFPILNQTIPNVATDVVVQSILEAAPVDTTHAELAMNDSKQCGTSISISKKEGSFNFHIEVETKGAPTVFLKKIERNGTHDFEFIALNQEAAASEQTRTSAEGRQFIALELEKDETTSYSMSCNNLFRNYKIHTSDGN